MSYLIVVDLGRGEEAFEFRDCRNAVLAWASLDDFCEWTDLERPEIYEVVGGVRSTFNPNEHRGLWETPAPKSASDEDDDMPRPVGGTRYQVLIEAVGSTYVFGEFADAALAARIMSQVDPAEVGGRVVMCVAPVAG